MPPLYYLSEKTVEYLKDNIEANLNRYLDGDFQELYCQNGWNIEFENRNFDLDILSKLDGTASTAASDIENSKIVFQALKNLTPSEACEERIWLRLSHVECFQYSCDRWLRGKTERDKQIKSIRKHFFAIGRNGIRDDHAISRLWWNAYVAQQAFPDDFERALKLILSSADIRQAIIERPWISTRVNLLRGILRSLENNTVLLNEENFRTYIKTVNKAGAGIIFEALTETEIDEFLSECSPAKKIERNILESI